jgi:sulfide dehydrogenase [flavocytochrome c] flavoprotein subunit
MARCLGGWPGDARRSARHVSTCCSHVGPDCGFVIFAAYRTQDDRLVEVEGSGGISPRNEAPGANGRAFRRLEAVHADGWYHSITQTMFALA